MHLFGAILGLLLASFVSGQNVDIEPREAVRRVGADVTFKCKVDYPIDNCRISVSGVTYLVKPGVIDGDFIYAGNGLQFGECGAHIKNIRDEYNGPVKCFIPPKTGNRELEASMNLIVARAPQDMQLLTPEQPINSEGDTFTAQCVVLDSRPAATITWYIDDQPLLVGPHEPVLSTDPTTQLQSVSQNVSLSLSAEENARRLVCRAEHEAMNQPIMKSRQLIVHYAPKRLQPGKITVFGLKLGSTGRLNVTVRAHPAPAAAWTAGGERVRGGTGRLRAIEPVPLENGFYNCSLEINNLEKEDVDRQYTLTVTNDLGEEQFTVQLSTLDEPAGVELDAGAIVGIVIAVLVLLIAVFLVVFAKATDRWCFAGGRRRDAKGSGESDTESAVVGKPERSRLAELSARVRAVLPRGRDKVQTSDAAPVDSEGKPLSEEKKNVVYAELALGDGGRDKPAPPSTEYAEIVYTNQGDASQQPTTETKQS